MTHPRKVQRRIDEGKLLGDCEDHAGYWAATLSISDLAEEVHFGSIFYKKDGKKLGHHVCVFKHDGFWYWSDYNTPYSLVERDEWVQSVLVRYGDTLRYAFMHPVTRAKDSRLRFGKAITYPRKR
jgi:hypothetical protein